MNEKIKLVNYCDKLVTAGIIYPYEEKPGRVVIETRSCGNRTVDKEIKRQFEFLGFTVQDGAYDKIEVFYNTSEMIKTIKEIFRGN